MCFRAMLLQDSDPIFRTILKSSRDHCLLRDGSDGYHRKNMTALLSLLRCEWGHCEYQSDESTCIFFWADGSQMGSHFSFAEHWHLDGGGHCDDDNCPAASVTSRIRCRTIGLLSGYQAHRRLGDHCIGRCITDQWPAVVMENQVGIFHVVLGRLQTRVDCSYGDIWCNVPGSMDQCHRIARRNSGSRCDR